MLVLTGFGNVITGSSHSGSMGEHQVSHWIDMFAGDAHPGSKHGQQVGVASLAMARLQEELLSLDKPPLDQADEDQRSGFRPALWRGHRPHVLCGSAQEGL